MKHRGTMFLDKLEVKANSLELVQWIDEGETAHYFNLSTGERCWFPTDLISIDQDPIIGPSCLARW